MPYPILPSGNGASTKNDSIPTVNVNTLLYDSGASDFHSLSLLDIVSPSGVSDDDAALMFDIWLNKDEILTEASNRVSNGDDDVYVIPENLRGSAKIIDLKRKGFIDGGDYTVRFTPKGKEVIKNMILFGEESAFDKKNAGRIPRYSQIQQRMKENMHKSSSRRKRG